MHLLIYGNYYSYVRSGPRKTFYSLVEFTFNALSSMQAQAATPPTLGLIIIIIVALSSAITALWDEWLPRNSKWFPVKVLNCAFIITLTKAAERLFLKMHRETWGDTKFAFNHKKVWQSIRHVALRKSGHFQRTGGFYSITRCSSTKTSAESCCVWRNILNSTEGTLSFERSLKKYLESFTQMILMLMLNVFILLKAA